MVSALVGAAIFRYSWWGLSLLLMFAVVSSNGKIYCTKKMFAVLCAVFVFVIILNRAFRHSDYITTIRWLYCFLFCFLAAGLSGCWEKVILYLVSIGFVHAIATNLFWLVPSLYSNMDRLWGYWPSGTDYGNDGYKAGLANHYSRNGIVLAVTYLALFAIIFADKMTKENEPSAHKKRNLRRYAVMFLITFWAVVLTTKRAHLLFGMIAMITVYYFSQPQKMGTRTFKLVIGGLVCGIALSAAAEYVPVIGAVFDRFSSIDDDTSMLSRFSFWRLAISMFLQNPLLGQGWFAFRYQYRRYLYDPTVRSERYTLLDSHNVYFQLLAETGIVGFIIYVTIVIYILANTFYMIRKHIDVLKKNNMSMPLFFSACMQIFFLLYSFTGNCLYDITSAFYFLAAAITLSCKSIVKRSLKNNGDYHI